MKPPKFLEDYILFNSGNECTRNYHLWSALVVLAAAMGRRIHLDWGYFTVHPNLYVCLVGRQGFRKSTAKDIARDMFCEAFPDIPVGASVQSREDIIKFLASDESIRLYTDENGVSVEYHPMVLFINELKNFLSINPGGMIDFLTDIYDRRYFDASTIKRGLEKIPNPCINILACETPKWIVDKLKMNIISGGFSRRMIYVYETIKGPKISFPTISPEAQDARLRCIAHLGSIAHLTGQFKWTPGASKFFDHWYQNLKAPDDEIMEGYYESKHIQLLKITMLLIVADPNPQLILTEEALQLGVALLDSIEVNMPKLSVAAGRNELAVPQQRLMEFLESKGGAFPEKWLMKEMDKDLTPMEQFSLIRHLVETEQIYKLPMRYQGADRQMLVTAAKRKELLAAAQTAMTNVLDQPSSSSCYD